MKKLLLCVSLFAVGCEKILILPAECARPECEAVDLSPPPDLGRGLVVAAEPERDH